MEIPKNYQTVMPYLIVQNASEFIGFTQKVFNAVENNEMRSMRDEHTIMHAEVMIGASTIMFADATEKYNTRPAGLFVYVENADKTYQRAIEAGATILTELVDQPYGRSGGITDPFGNVWWITSVK